MSCGAGSGGGGGGGQTHLGAANHTHFGSSYGSKFWVCDRLGFDDNGHLPSQLQAQKHA